jgi:hypothetical protein
MDEGRMYSILPFFLIQLKAKKLRLKSQEKKESKMKNRVGLLVFLIGLLSMLLVVSACGRKDHVEENPYARLSKADMKYQNVQIVNFTISPRGVQDSDPRELLAQTQSTCAEALMNSRLFENVKSVSSAEQANSTLLVKAELTKLRIVGGGARFWIGAMAGKSEMAFYVKLSDASTGQVITEKDIRDDTDPSSGAWSVGASDRALPAAVGNQIADLVINAARK